MDRDNFYNIFRKNSSDPAKISEVLDSLIQPMIAMDDGPITPFGNIEHLKHEYEDMAKKGAQGALS